MAGKRAANGAGSIRQRADGRWEAIVTLGTDPATGKPLKKSIYAKTQKQVRQKMNKVITQVDEGTYKKPQKMTLGIWMDTWIDQFCREIRPYTMTNYRGATRHIKEHLNAVRLDALTVVQLQKMFNAWSDEGYAKTTIAMWRRVIHAALQKAVDLEYIKTNPVSKCNTPTSTVSDEIHPITGEALQQFLQRIENDKYRNVFMVSIFSGMREGQLFGLTWDQVDFDLGAVHLEHQVQWRTNPTRWELCPLKSTDSYRTVMLAPQVIDILKEQLEHQQTIDCRRSTWHNTGNFVFTSFDGDPLRQCTLHHHYKRIVSEIGMPDARIHDMRHSYATLSLENGDDLKTVSANLGHSSVAITGDIYSHATEKLRKQSAERMGKLINSIVGQNVGQSVDKEPETR